MGSRDLCLGFWDPLLILGTADARNYKLSMRLPQGGTNEKCNTMSNGVVEKLHDLVLKFWDPLYILGTAAELKSSNLASNS